MSHIFARVCLLGMSLQIIFAPICWLRAGVLIWAVALLPAFGNKGQNC